MAVANNMYPSVKQLQFHKLRIRWAAVNENDETENEREVLRRMSFVKSAEEDNGHQLACDPFHLLGRCFSSSFSFAGIDQIGPVFNIEMIQANQKRQVKKKTDETQKEQRLWTRTHQMHRQQIKWIGIFETKIMSFEWD